MPGANWQQSREQHCTGHDHEQISRRRVVAGAGALATVGLAGCLGAGEDPPDAVALTNEDTCEVCGMVIPKHPGPSAEIFYADRQPNGHANPARFDSTWEAFQFDFARQEEGWTREAFYVTDYSGVDYQVFEEGGDRLISTHPEASAFAPAEDVTFVVGSEVKGAMGEDLVGFTAQSDAESFRDEYGGDLAGLDDVTPTTISQLGR